MNRASQVRRLMKRFGELPESWGFVPLGDLLEERQETSSDIAQYPLNSLIIGEGIVPKDERYNRTFLLRDEEKNRYNLVYPGNFVFNPMNLRFGAIAYSRHKVPVTVSAYYTVLAPSTREFDPRYLYKLLTSHQIMDLYDVIAIGSLIEKRRVYWSDLKELIIPFPPLEVQRTIGTIIDAWDRAIALTERRIEAARQRKKGLMQRLLTGRARFPEFVRSREMKDTKLGVYPEEWAIRRLSDVAEIQVSYVDKKSKPSEQRVLLCNYMDVFNNDYIHNQMDFMEASATESEIQKCALREQDVIITKDSETREEIAEPAVVVEDLKNVVCGYHLAILRPKRSIISGFFLKDALRSSNAHHQFVRFANGITRFGLTLSAIHNALLPVPTINEQKKIAAVLQTCDREIELLEQKRDALQRQRKGLMQRLLTGRVRVKV